MTQALLDHTWIATHIPQSDAMRLLDAVIEWDETRIRCVTTSHRDPANPLRSYGRLAAVCGIEYAAQAMAAHGALVSGSHGQPRSGFLASVRNVDARIDRIDTLEAPLMVDAECLSGNADSSLYAFALRCGERVVLAGRAAVLHAQPKENLT